jgi:class I fructose-bisphosphate aldolase
MYMELREIARRRRPPASPSCLELPRGEDRSSKKGETAIDVIAYAAQIAAQLGAHIIKVKPPTEHLEQDAAKKVYEAEGSRSRPSPSASPTSSRAPSPAAAS